MNKRIEREDPGRKAIFHGVVAQADNPHATGTAFSEECLRKMAEQDDRLEFKDGQLIFHGAACLEGDVEDGSPPASVVFRGVENE